MGGSLEALLHHHTNAHSAVATLILAAATAVCCSAHHQEENQRRRVARAARSRARAADAVSAAAVVVSGGQDPVFAVSKKLLTPAPLRSGSAEYPAPRSPPSVFVPPRRGVLLTPSLHGRIDPKQQSHQTSGLTSGLAEGKVAVTSGPEPETQTPYGDNSQVAGHPGGIRFEGPHLLKRLQGASKHESSSTLSPQGDVAPSRGEKEATFLLQTAPAHRFLRDKVPGAHKIVTHPDGSRWIVMDNLTAGFIAPAILDIKMGKLTYGPDATSAKIASRRKRDAGTTTISHGLRICGGKVPTDGLGSPLRPVGNKMGVEVSSHSELLAVLRDFFATPALLNSATTFVAELQEWFEGQTQFAFYASSILLAYDSSLDADSATTGSNSRGLTLRAKMIDFSHVHAPTERCVAGPRAGKPLQTSGRDESYLTGLNALQELLHAV